MPKRDPDNELWLNWSKTENDILIHYPRSCDGALLYQYFGSEMPQYDFLNKENHCQWRKSLVQELKERGYDIESIKFSIKLKPKENPIDTPHKDVL